MTDTSGNPAEASNKPKSAYAKTWETAQQAFKLIAKNRTSSDPVAFAVWYGYVTGDKPALNAAMETLLAETGGISSAEMQQLHAEHIEDNSQTEEQLDDISRAIQNEVAGAKSLVTDIISNTDEYVSSMDKAKSLLPASTQAEFMDTLGGLIEQTETSRESAQSIQVALQSKHDEITQLSSKVIELRDNLMRDSLTELVNQQKFEALLKERSADAIANGYSLTVLAAGIKNIQDLNDKAGMDISEFVVKSFAGIARRVVADQGVCGRFSNAYFGILLPRAAYADAAKVANAIIEELDVFKIIKKPSEQLVGHIECAFGGTSLRPGHSPRDLIAFAMAQAQQAKQLDRSSVKFDLTNRSAA